jgi:FkbM family methyltransferase
MRTAAWLPARQAPALVLGSRKGLVKRSADYRTLAVTLNLPTFAVRVSELVKQFPLLHKGLRRLYCLFHPGIRFHVAQTFRSQKDIFVLKIGANDGITNDPIGEYLLSDSRYHGVLVEPVPYYAQLLADNFALTARFSIEQVAVSQSSGQIKVYYIPENASDRLGQYFDVAATRPLASLERKHLLKHLAPEYHNIVESVTVDCLTVKDLLSRTHIKHIDLLNIDAEGHDWIILQQFDFDRVRPKIVLFEREHLNRVDQEAARKMMQNAGYQVKAVERDFLCLLK